jgi:sec-independent protein translocase protein TatB
MLDMSWGEMMVIGAVALIVIGPKDLPKALRTLGQMTGKVRRMASEFQNQFNEAMREAELDEAKQQIRGLNDSVGGLTRSFDPVRTIRDELKGAIEPPAGAADGTGSEVIGGSQAESDLASLPPAVDIHLPLPAPPSAADAAESVATAVQQPAEDLAKRAEMPGEKA